MLFDACESRSEKNVPAEVTECSIWPDADLDENCLQKFESVIVCVCEQLLVVLQVNELWKLFHKRKVEYFCGICKVLILFQVK